MKVVHIAAYPLDMSPACSWRWYDFLVTLFIIITFKVWYAVPGYLMVQVQLRMMVNIEKLQEGKYYTRTSMSTGFRLKVHYIDLTVDKVNTKLWLALAGIYFSYIGPWFCFMNLLFPVDPSL